MALSDIMKKIEDSPRSTKVAVASAGVAVAASAVAIFAIMNQNDYRPEPENPVAKVAAAPTATFSALTPTPRPTPAPTSTAVPTPVPTSTPPPTPLPTETPLPTATATPDVDDYFVILHAGKNLIDDKGRIAYYASYPFNENVNGIPDIFYGENFYLEYLRKRGVITSEQKDAYFDGEPIKIPLVPIATVTNELFEEDPHNAGKLRLRFPDYLLYHAGKSYSDSDDGGNGALDGKISLEGSKGHVMISDGMVSVSRVDGEGNTTTVDVEGVGVEDLLDYWLSENKITIEQRNEYGETGKIELSLKDGVDLLDFRYSDEGIHMGIDEEAHDTIINKILPLFSSD